MPSQVERRQAKFKNRVRIGGVSASDSYTQFNGLTDGWQSQSGCARFLKEIYLSPTNFDVRLANASGVGASGLLGACSIGSLFGSCVTFDFTASAFGGGAAASNMSIVALNMGAGASPASPLTAIAVFPKPTDIDTSGSIIAYVDWTYGDAPATTGSKVSMRVALGYLGTGSTIRTAASAGVPVGTASYSGTSCGLFQTTCIGKLPSWTANDQLGVAVLQLGASAGADSGKLSTACVFVLALRLRYTACALGIQSAE